MRVAGNTGDEGLHPKVVELARGKNFAALTIWDREDPYRFVEVRGEVVGITRGPEAREHIDELSHKYHGRSYRTKIRSERVILRIAPFRQVIRMPSWPTA